MVRETQTPPGDVRTSRVASSDTTDPQLRSSTAERTRTRIQSAGILNLQPSPWILVTSRLPLPHLTP